MHAVVLVLLGLLIFGFQSPFRIRDSLSLFLSIIFIIYTRSIFRACLHISDHHPLLLLSSIFRLSLMISSMAGSTNNVYLHLSDATALSSQADLTEGRVEVRFAGARFQNLWRSIMNRSGVLDPFDYHMSPPTSTFVNRVPAYLFSYPHRHFHYLWTQISSRLIDLIGFENQHRLRLARNIASFAIRQLVAGNEARGSRPGYYIVAEVRMLQSEVLFDEILDDQADQQSAIEKLIEKGKFVARKDDEDHELGTCGICIEDFSSSVGAELLRMDCSHIYHRDCMLPWLAKSNTCPTCRAKLYC